MLSLQNFGVAFGERVVLDAVTQDIRTPGCTVLLGPSGTGKSTLLRTLAGFNDANPALRTWGSVRYGASAADHVRPALVMQNAKLLVSTVHENLVCNLPDRAALGVRQQLRQIAPLLEQTGWSHLMGKLSHRVVSCSLGEQRCIAILRCALSTAPLIMVDEPTAELQVDACTSVLNLLSSLSAQHGILVVLRNLMEARRVADRIVLLANGTIQEAGAADAFFAQPSSECGRLFLATGSCPEASRASADEAIEPLADKAGSESLDKTVVASHVSQAVGPRGFLWVLPGRLAGTPWPGIVQDVDYDLRALQAVGITHLVSLTEQRLDDTVLARYGMGCTHSAMPDMQPPTEAQALELCQRMDHLLAKGETLAIHCRAGLGRTGTVLAAYWLWLGSGHRSALKALEDMRRIEPMWVQSQSQVDFLETFAACVARRALTNGAHNPVAGSAGNP